MIWRPIPCLPVFSFCSVHWAVKLHWLAIPADRIVTYPFHPLPVFHIPSIHWELNFTGYPYHHLVTTLSLSSGVSILVSSKIKRKILALRFLPLPLSYSHRVRLLLLPVKHGYHFHITWPFSFLHPSPICSGFLLQQFIWVNFWPNCHPFFFPFL